jgi:uncharacterized protein (TIGR03437 family)
MVMRGIICSLVYFLWPVAGWAQTITTFAGNGTAGFSGDNGPATQAMINRVVGLAADSAGNVYLAEENSNRVRKVDRNGVITTLAGTGTAGFSGDNGSAAQAQLSGPLGVCVDSAGNVYVNDNGNKRVRKISTNGTITTIAGSGSATHSGDGGPATAAGFAIPIRCAVDSNGNVYIADQGAHRVRIVSPAGTINTYAGNGTAAFSGDGGQATAAALNNPTALSTDSAGNVYIDDQFNNRVRKVDANGFIETVAGNGTSAFGGDGGSATSASFSFPGSVVADRGGNLFIVDTLANRIRKVTDGIITTVAGTGTQGFGGDNGPPLQDMFNAAFAIALDPSGNLYIGDTGNNRIRKISGIAVGTLPTFTSAGVTNGASFKTGIAPGGIVTIFGFNLGANPTQIITAPGLTWLPQLSGVTVTMDGTAVPVYRVLNLNGQEQLSVQAPFSLAGKTSTTVVVTNAAGTSVALNVPVLAVQPGIFLLDTDRNAATHANGTVVTSANAAARGETVVFYLTGMGAVDNPPASGQPASLTLARTLVTPQVTMAGLDAPVSFSGLTPGFIGLYQINAVVPAPVGTASFDVTVTAGGVTSNVARMSVR